MPETDKQDTGRRKRQTNSSAAKAGEKERKTGGERERERDGSAALLSAVLHIVSSFVTNIHSPSFENSVNQIIATCLNQQDL